MHISSLFFAFLLLSSLLSITVFSFITYSLIPLLSLSLSLSSFFLYLVFLFTTICILHDFEIALCAIRLEASYITPRPK